MVDVRGRAIADDGVAQSRPVTREVRVQIVGYEDRTLRADHRPHVGEQEPIAVIRLLGAHRAVQRQQDRVRPRGFEPPEQGVAQHGVGREVDPAAGHRHRGHRGHNLAAAAFLEHVIEP